MKKKLSGSGCQFIELVVPGMLPTLRGARDLRLRVERPLVEALWTPAIERSIDTCAQALALIGPRGRHRRLSAIYLSGGTSYVPAVRRALEARLRVPIRVATPPGHAVCLGAGIHAARLGRAAGLARTG